MKKKIGEIFKFIILNKVQEIIYNNLINNKYNDRQQIDNSFQNKDIVYEFILKENIAILEKCIL